MHINSRFEPLTFSRLYFFNQSLSLAQRTVLSSLLNRRVQRHFLTFVGVLKDTLDGKSDEAHSRRAGGILLEINLLDSPCERQAT